MTSYEVTITQTITRVIKVECFEPQPNREYVKDQVREYGVTEAFSDYPEIEEKSSIVTKIVAIKKVN